MRTSKYTSTQNELWSGEVAFIIAEETKFLSIDEIKEKSLILKELSSQKIARILNNFITYGLAEKQKGKNGKMMYRGVCAVGENITGIEEGG